MFMAKVIHYHSDSLCPGDLMSWYQYVSVTSVYILSHEVCYNGYLQRSFPLLGVLLFSYLPKSSHGCKRPPHRFPASVQNVTREMALVGSCFLWK